ncbi:macro domain-containing protein [Chitinophaga horti]|uniref:Macro domain-containing protein n=1 Tax=Chitinophaga horti TaxID=2920382 RepID=A0ABY6IZF7_9BACT|nr:macro domain-containing protein [Chitinophaga horti]UYQ92665.1 macro domain-containing protein [Chitinophaga horti]
MIHYTTGNLLESKAEALVNTVNTEGVMGKGIALQFKQAFPNNYKIYQKACKNNELTVGKLLVTEEESLLAGNKIIINFPTKTSWRKPSEYSYINDGLLALVDLIKERSIKSIAVPPLGAGNGGLEWTRVKEMLLEYLGPLECDIYIYEPSKEIKEVLRKERVKLTPARAMLLAVLYDSVSGGEFVSEFSAEKIAYFLQRFGGEGIFNLNYSPNFYGPYSGKVKHVLYYLNGSYIKGYSSKDKKPFEELGLIPEAAVDIDSYLSQPENVHYKEIVDKTKSFLQGFYSSFGLELLSTIDFIMVGQHVRTVEEVRAHLEGWSNRKKTLFSNDRFIRIAVDNLSRHLSYS